MSFYLFQNIKRDERVEFNRQFFPVFFFEKIYLYISFFNDTTR